MRLLLIILALVLVFAGSWFIFGDRFDLKWQGDEAVIWLRDYGAWAWAVAMGLIVVDLVLPIPATGVMAGLGIIYGPIVGGMLSGVASVIAGAIAYGATRLLGHRAALFLVGEHDLNRAESFFTRAGGYAVALSRPLPLLPEVIACLAGMARMRPTHFFVALCCGSFPSGFIFAGLGSWLEDRAWLGITIGAVVPLLLWPLARRLLNSKAGGD